MAIARSTSFARDRQFSGSTGGRRNAPRDVVRLLRPHQWLKNVLVLMAPLAAGVLQHGNVWPRVLAMFVAFCALSSATYVFNDAADRGRDQRHPVKRNRPLASGAVTLPVGLAVGAVLAVAALVGIGFYGWRPLLVLVIYAAIQVAYSGGVKRIAVLELAAVASGFVLRAIAGALVVPVPVSKWFLIVASFAALLVVAGKRLGERVQLGDAAPTSRKVLGDYPVSYLRAVVLIAAGTAVTAYCLWAFEQGTPTRHPIVYQLTVIPFVLALLRYVLLVERGVAEAPEDLALHDRTLLGCGLAWVAVFAVAVYTR